jgi:acid stress-induced BolA-like protein IbaG/YrbA
LACEAEWQKHGNRQVFRPEDGCVTASRRRTGWFVSRATGGCMMSDLTKTIEDAIRNALPGAQVKVRSPMNDDAHFEATVISEAFDGLPLMKQHRLVMQPLKGLLAGEVHALALKTYTPEKWAGDQG